MSKLKTIFSFLNPAWKPQLDQIAVMERNALPFPDFLIKSIMGIASGLLLPTAFIFSLLQSGVSSSDIVAVISHPSISKALLLAAGVYCSMLTLFGTLLTAWEGAPLGKDFSSIWTPIKLVMLVSFLIPLENDLSPLQLVLLDIVKWLS